jgi:hypothetical protein
MFSKTKQMYFCAFRFLKVFLYWKWSISLTTNPLSWSILLINLRISISDFAYSRKRESPELLLSLITFIATFSLLLISTAWITIPKTPLPIYLTNLYYPLITVPSLNIYSMPTSSSSLTAYFFIRPYVSLNPCVSFFNILSFLTVLLTIWNWCALK